MIVIGILVKTLRMSLYTISQKKDGDFCLHLNASNPKKVAWLAGWLAGWRVWRRQQLQLYRVELVLYPGAASRKKPRNPEAKRGPQSSSLCNKRFIARWSDRPTPPERIFIPLVITDKYYRDTRTTLCRKEMKLLIVSHSRTSSKYASSLGLLK